MVLQHDQLMKRVGMMKKVKGLEEATNDSLNTYQGQVNALAKQWASMQATVLKPLLPATEKLLGGVRGVLEWIEKHSADNPAASYAGVAAAGGLGAILLRTMGLRALIGGGLGYLAGGPFGALLGSAALGGVASGATGATTALGGLVSTLGILARVAGPIATVLSLAASLWSIHNAIAGDDKAKETIGLRTSTESKAGTKLYHETLRRKYASDTAEDTLRFTGLPLDTKRGGWSIDDIKRTFQLAPIDLSQQGAQAGQSWFNSALEWMKKLGSQTVPGPQIAPPAAPAAPAAGGGEKHSSIIIHNHIHGAGNPHEVAEAVHKRFLASVERQLSDGAYA
jgi:hypothetical protein